MFRHDSGENGSICGFRICHEQKEGPNEKNLSNAPCGSHARTVGIGCSCRERRHSAYACEHLAAHGHRGRLCYRDRHERDGRRACPQLQQPLGDKDHRSRRNRAFRQAKRSRRCRDHRGRKRSSSRTDLLRREPRRKDRYGGYNPHDPLCDRHKQRGHLRDGGRLQREQQDRHR